MYSVHNTNTRHQTAYAGQTDDWRDYSFGLRTRQTYWANTSPILLLYGDREILSHLKLRHHTGQLHDLRHFGFGPDTLLKT